MKGFNYYLDRLHANNRTLTSTSLLPRQITQLPRTWHRQQGFDYLGGSLEQEHCTDNKVSTIWMDHWNKNIAQTTRFPLSGWIIGTRTLHRQQGFHYLDGSLAKSREQTRFSLSGWIIGQEQGTDNKVSTIWMDHKAINRAHTSRCLLPGWMIGEEEGTYIKVSTPWMDHRPSTEHQY